MGRMTKLKLMVTVAFLMAVSSLKAQSIGDITDFSPAVAALYCAGASVKISAVAEAGTSTYKWLRYKDSSVAGSPDVLTETSINLTDAPTDPGYYTYVSVGLTALGCESAPSDPITVYVLPGISATITSSAPAVTEYCENALPASLKLTAVGSKTGTTVSENFTYNYQWYKDGVALSGSGANTAEYTINSTNDATVGAAFSYTVKVTYAVKPTCTDATSNAITFKVNVKAGKPQISIVP